MSRSSFSSDSNLEISPPSALELLWINHRGAVIGGASAVVLIALVALGVIISIRSTHIASETLLANATDETGWNEVIAKYPHTPAAADAMLLLAASLRDAGKLEESNEMYSRFAESFPNSSIAVSGLLGRAANSRVANQPDNAVSSYQEAAAQYAQSYGAPFALFTELQILAQQGKTEDAHRVLTALTSQYPGSVAAQKFVGASQGSPSSESSSSASSGSSQ
jgi:tetratricopeptide (TPR) repeat protein